MPRPEPHPTLEEQMNKLWDEAYIMACEADSPNSPDHERLVEHFFEQLCSKKPANASF